MNITMTLRYDKLQAGISAAQQFTKRTTPEIVNHVAYSVALDAFHNTPFVPMGRVHQELGVLKTPVKTLSGRLSKRQTFYKTRKVNIRGQSVELAVLIIQARTKPGSYYNASTGGRWQLPEHAFKGLPKKLQEQKMAYLIDAMIRQRDKSGHFFQAGFLAAVKAFSNGSGGVLSLARHSMPSNVESRSADVLGSGIVAPANTYHAVARILNLIGTQGKNQASMNDGLFKHVAPVLQKALDNEGQKQMDWALKQFMRKNAETVNKLWR